jgi:hypothetical protein
LAPVVTLFNRRLRISGLLERRSGFTQIDAGKERACALGLCRAVVDPTTPLAVQADVVAKRYYLPAPGQGSTSMVWLTNGAYTRLREVTVATDLARRLTRAVHARSGSISLAARNLAIWSKIKDADPESGTSSSDGVPQGRTWVVRLDLGL